VQTNSKSIWSILDSSMTMFIMNIWKWWNHVCVIIFQYCIFQDFRWFSGFVFHLKI
jgi:hypothetical protein